MVTLDDLKAKGIVFSDAKGVMAYDENGRTDFKKTVSNMAMDAALNPNVGAPASFYQWIDPQIVEVLFGVTNAGKLAGEVKQGDWTQDFYNFPVEEINGGVTAYNDFDETVTTDVNYNYPVRELARFQTNIKYGDLEAEKASVAKIQLASRKQLAAAKVIAQYQNHFYLYGVSGKANYGMLNEPNLNPSVSPITIGGNSTWATKTAADPANAANIVYNDILKLWSDIESKNGGHADVNGRIVLGISNAMVSYLDMPNTYGKTAREILKGTMPGLEIVTIPELTTSSGEYLYMVIPDILGQESCNCAYADKFRAGRLIPGTTSMKQKVVGTSWGFILKRASAVGRMLGI